MPVKLTRRAFIAGSLAVGGGVIGPTSKVIGANDRLRLAVIGTGSMGIWHVEAFDRLPDVSVVAVCDADRNRMSEAAKKLKHTVHQHQDYRKILNDKNIDAVVIATPNHWHAPMTMLACQAGKHVYVEKPVSHGITEGRKMVNASRKYNRIVQAGTQHRSDPYYRQVTADLRAGKYGKVNWVHCSGLVAGYPLGKVKKSQPIPKHIDYDLWCGPSPKVPVMRDPFHFYWHWQWNWGDVIWATGVFIIWMIFARFLAGIPCLLL